MFNKLKVGASYSRPTLASLWGYRGYQALARGVVTPRGKNFIILFVTEEKQESLRDYKDALMGKKLLWEGPDDHFAEKRMREANSTSDQIHVFHRERHHSDFVYLGEAEVVSVDVRTSEPSKFEFVLNDL